MSDEEQTFHLKVADTESSSVLLPAAGRAGALLRLARETAGYSLESLAAIVKVPVRKLEALEAGRLEALPEPVYVRGIVVGICRVLHADAQAILALLPAAPAKPLRQEGAIAPMPFEMTGAESPHRLFEAVAKPHIRWTLAFVLGAALLYFWPAISSWTIRSAAESEALTALQPWVAKGTVALVSQQDAGTAPLPSESPVEVSPSSVLPLPANQASAPVEVPLPVAEELVHLKAHGKTWVEVSDGRGVVVLRRLLADGEQTGVGGQPPLSVVVGNADFTEVWVRGKVYEIKSISQGNVARFEVK